MWTWDEGLFTTLNTCAEAVRRLQKHKGLRFICAGSWAHQWLERVRPDLWRQIRRLIRRRRWVPVGGWYVQADTQLPCGESLIRQALVGQKMFGELTSIRSDVAYLVDSFGHPATLPKVLRHCGFRYFTFARPGAENLDLPAPLFNWVADDGSDLLCYRIPVNYCTYDDEVERVGVSIGLIEGRWDSTMCFFGLGDHGGGPTAQQIRRLEDYAQSDDAPELIFSDPGAFFEEIRGANGVPELRGALEPYAVGCHSAAAGLKRTHDLAQRALLLAEKYLALAEAVGVPVPEESRHEVRRAWEDLLFVQFHDLLPGSSIRRGQEHAAQLAGAALTRAESARVLAMTGLTQHVETRADAYLRFVVWNHAGVDRTVYLEYEPWLFWQDWDKYRLVDSRGRSVLHQRLHPEAAAPAVVRLIIKLRMPAHGYEVLRVVGPEPDFSAMATYDVGRAGMVNRRVCGLKTPRYHVALDRRAGTIKRIRHVASGTVMSFDRLLDAMALTDRSDTWSLKQTGYPRQGGRFSHATITQIEPGPLRWTVRTDRRFGRSRLVQEIRVFDESDLIEVHNRIDWREPWRVLKMVVPLPFAGARVRRGVAFGSDLAPGGGREFPFQNWLLIEPAGEMRTKGLAALAVIVGPGLHAADITAQGLRLTLLRSPVYCHAELTRPYEPHVRHEHMDLGEHTCVFALLPIFAGGQRDLSPARLVELSHSLADPVGVVTTDGHAGDLPAKGRWMRVEPKRVALTALKPAQDGEGVVVRLWETTGKAAQCTVHWMGEKFRVRIPGHAIRTLKLTRRADRWSHQFVNGIEHPNV